MSEILVWAGSVPSAHEVSGCRQCSNSEGRLARYVKANASVGLRWQCSSCGDFGTFGDIAHGLLATFGVELDALPVCCDRLQTSTPCAICGESGTEWHHWAPSAIFGGPEWSDVGAYLCLAHHREWHDVMRAHGLRFPHELARPAA